MAEENIVIKIKADVGITKEVIEAVTKAMEGLGKTATIVSGNVKVTNKNLEDTNKILGQVAETAKKTTGAIGGAGDSVKKSNQQWLALSLVIQDLPYGFRGIQNNLPALLGGVAAVGGAAYFAFSAIVALYTAYGQQINDAILKTTDLEKAQRELGKSTIEAAKSTDTARTEILKITSIVQAAKDGFIDKSAAIQLYNEKLGDSFGKVTTLAEAEQALIDKSPKYIEALMLKAKAEYYFAKASEFAVKKDIAGLEDQTSALDKLLITANTAFAFADASNGVKGIIKTFVESFGQLQTESVAGVKKTAGAIADVLTVEGKKTMTAYYSALKDAGLNDADIQAIIDKLNKKLLKSNVQADQLADKANEARDKSYLDTLDERAKKEYQAFLKLEDNLAIMKAAGYKDDALHFAAYKANMAKIAKEYDDKEYKRNQDSINANIAFETKIYKDSMNAWEDIQRKKADSQAKYTKGTVDALELELKTQLKLHKNNITLMQEDISNKIKQLELLKVFAFSNVESIEIINRAINNQKAQLKGLGERWDSTAQQIKTTIEGVMTEVITQFATNIGKALAGEKVDLFGGIGEMIADGAIAIGKALIAYGVALTAFKLAKLNPALAIVAGAGLVVAGSFLKSKLSSKNKTEGATPFASGGIVSGPTMGLIGEYPGAKSNPEVVAPLDKLKDMLGGGGGQFVLRGNDLVLALNRSETSLNLRRGS